MAKGWFGNSEGHKKAASQRKTKGRKGGKSSRKPSDTDQYL